MHSENRVAKITDRATPANLVSIANTASIGYSQELVFHVLARILNKP